MTEKTTQEKIEYLSKQEKGRQEFAKLKDVLQLINLEKTKTITSSTYNKENLRSPCADPECQNRDA